MPGFAPGIFVSTTGSRLSAFSGIGRDQASRLPAISVFAAIGGA
jgi:hypothetical protein